VLVPGPKGAPDDMLVIYYGNVFVGPDGLLWMYYLAAGYTDPVWKGKAPDSSGSASRSRRTASTGPSRSSGW
jgi:hypothetical protein